MRNSKYKIFSIFLISVCLTFLVFQYTFAQGLWEKLFPPGTEIPEMAAPAEEPGPLIARIVTWIMGFIGAIAVGFIVWGAWGYVMSAGNEKKIEEAKRVILYAIIGFVIAILAVVIVQTIGRAVARYPCDELDGWSCIEGAWNPTQAGCECVGEPPKCTGTCCTPPAGYSECKASLHLPECGNDFCCGTGTLCCCR